MAVSVEELRATLRMEMKPFIRDLQQMNGVSAKAAKQLEGTWRDTNRKLDGMGKNMAKSLIAPMTGLVAALGVRELGQLADTWSDLSARVELAAGSQEKGIEVMGRLGEMARMTYSSLEQTTESYLSNSDAVSDLGYSTEKALDYTEALNNALVVSGAKGDRAKSVIDALSKAMALGKLSGDNLNTVISTGGRAAKALADGLGTTVTGLRKLGSQGKITGRDIVTALTSQMVTLRNEANGMRATISDGVQLLNNALLQYVGNADTATGISAKIAEALVIMADNFDTTADAALQLAAVMAGALLGRSVISMISSLGLGVKALNDFRKAIAAAQTMAGLATAFSGVSAAAGPVGMIIGGAVVGSLLLYSQTVGASSEGAKLFAARLKQVEDAAKSSGNAVDEAGKKNGSYNLNSIKAEVKEGSKEFDAAKQSVRAYFDEILAGGIPMKIVRDEAGKMSQQPLATPEQFGQLQKLRDELDKNSSKAGDVKDALQALANSNPNFQGLVDQLRPLLDMLINVSKAARLSNADLADAKTANGRSAKDDAQPFDRNAVASEAYEKEALRKAALNKKEHALELERVKVINDAMKDGTKLTEESSERIAKANLAAQERWSDEGKKPKTDKAPKKTEDDYIFQITQSVKDRTAALAEEAKISGLTFLEQEKRRTAMELEQDVLLRLREEARKNNDANWESITLSETQKDKINAVSDAYARQADELRKVQEAQNKAEQAASEFYDTAKSGFIGAITGANSLQDALSGILKKLAEMILNSAFDKLFSGATGSGGWLTNMFKIPGFATGTNFAPGGLAMVGERGPELVNLPRGSQVIPNNQLSSLAVPKAPSMPNIQGMNGGGGSVTAPVYISIDAKGADAAGLAKVQQQLTDLENTIPERVIQTVRKANSSFVKLR